MVYHKINIVCGGRDSSSTYLNSCETNVYLEDAWSLSTPLITDIAYLRGYNFDNKILMTGMHTLIFNSFTFALKREALKNLISLGGSLNHTGEISRRIFELDLYTNEWKELGTFLYSRLNHALSIVGNETWQYCNENA